MVLDIVSSTSLYLVNISMTGVYSGIQYSIYVKPFDIPLHFPLTTPSPTPQCTEQIWVLGDRTKTLNSSKWPNRRIANISNTISPLGFNGMFPNFSD